MVRLHSICSIISTDHDPIIIKVFVRILRFSMSGLRREMARPILFIYFETKTFINVVYIYFKIPMSFLNSH
jgi:hypothetical protein